MFITVQPDGQALVLRCMVSLVPRAVGHLNVPESATPRTQFLSCVPDGKLLNATSKLDKLEQLSNICVMQVVVDTSCALILAEVIPLQS